jgi:hypothetical protein
MAPSCAVKETNKRPARPPNRLNSEFPMLHEPREFRVGHVRQSNFIPAFSSRAGPVVASPCSPPSYEPLGIGPCAAVEVNLVHVGHQLFSAMTKQATLKLDRHKGQQNESHHNQTCKSEDAQKPPCRRHHLIRHRVYLQLVQPPDAIAVISSPICTVVWFLRCLGWRKISHCVALARLPRNFSSLPAASFLANRSIGPSSITHTGLRR